jgi:hypothetical protein
MVRELKMRERRRATRQRSFLQGRLFYNKRRNSVDCVIRDISETGARLKFSAAVTVPEALELYVPNKDQIYRVRVEWRHGEEVGVTFVQANTEASAGGAADDLAERVKKLESELSSLRRVVTELKGELRKWQGDAA